MKIKHLPSLYVLSKLCNEIALMEFTWVEGQGVSFCVSFFYITILFTHFSCSLKLIKSLSFISKPGQA